MTADGKLDFETYSPAGFLWDEATRKFYAPRGARQKGLPAVGSSVYTEHPEAEVLTASYDLHDGRGIRRWQPGQPMPQDLFDHLAAGRTVEAHNAMFEYLVWTNICVRKYGWPPLNPYLLRCSMATARVNSLPGSLADLGKVLGVATVKDADGKRLLNKFSIPRNPTKADGRLRILPQEDPADAERLYAYCDGDVAAEGAAAADPRMVPMSSDELYFWLVDQEINRRGVAIDRQGVRDCIAVLEQAHQRYGDECRALTGLDPTQLQALRGWLAALGVHMDSMDAEAVAAALGVEGGELALPSDLPDDYRPNRPPMPAEARRVLEIRQLLGSASVKKLYAMENQASRDDRLRNLIVHHGARTGRPTGEGPQPLNLPKAGPQLVRCGACARPFRPTLDACPWCYSRERAADKAAWKPAMVDDVLEIMATRSLELVEWFFGDALLCISGCVRGLFQAAPGHELIASDYTAIEAVVTAMLAGEEWRIETFRSRKDIYLVSASKITGKPEEFYADYKAQHGDNHPDRQKIGKVAELAMGFGGWLGAWRAFDSTDNFTDDQVKGNILAWRAASPAIVELWGGQRRRLPWGDWVDELHGIEGHAIKAIQQPGEVFGFRGLQFYMRGYQAAQPETYLGVDGQQHIRYVGGSAGALIIRLPSGRELTYHNPSLAPSPRRYGELAITYWTWNSNPKYGAMGWVPMSTFGGRLTENVVQAIAHDILRFAILNLRAAGYHTVLHVYDEIVVEVPEGAGSVEEVERIMSTLPPWAFGWPVFAAGGWRGKRYRKG